MGYIAVDIPHFILVYSIFLHILNKYRYFSCALMKLLKRYKYSTRKKQMKFNNSKIIYSMKVFTISVFVYSMQLRGVVYPATTSLHVKGENANSQLALYTLYYTIYAFSNVFRFVPINTDFTRLTIYLLQYMHLP